MRTPLVVGNWKMNGDRAWSLNLCADVVKGVQQMANVDVALCPPYPYLMLVSERIAGSGCALGAQDMDVHDNGAFTGQVSASMLIDCGCKYVVLGHCERRMLYGETDTLVAAKVKCALSLKLTAIVCVGETQQERDSGRTSEVISRQLQAVIDQVGIAAFSNIVVAYEPVWAIGTGNLPTPHQSQEVHKRIRQQLAQQNETIAQGTRILYGGSMKPDNAASLIACADIDGGLIGGAALKSEYFLAICKAAQTVNAST